MNEFPTLFGYCVKPENRCPALKGKADEHIFVGFVQYSNYFKQWYLTVDGISYTSLELAYNIIPIDPRLTS